MNYEVLSKENRIKILMERIGMHEQVFFELDTQLGEAETLFNLIPNGDDEDAKKRVLDHMALLKSQQSEIQTRIRAVKRMKSELEQPEPQAG